MKTLRLEFYECEHGGDLDYYIGDIIECGGQIKRSDVNEDAEIGWVTFDVKDEDSFMEKFKETEAYQFLN
jgi:hypothetical protein